MDDLTDLRKARDRAERLRLDLLRALQLIRLLIRNVPRSATAETIDQIAAEAIRKATE